MCFSQTWILISSFFFIFLPWWKKLKETGKKLKAAVCECVRSAWERKIVENWDTVSWFETMWEFSLLAFGKKTQPNPEQTETSCANCQILSEAIFHWKALAHRKHLNPALLQTQKLHLIGLYVDRHLITENNSVCVSPSSRDRPGWTLSSTSPGICCSCSRRQHFGAFVSPFSIANQLFANVTWVPASHVSDAMVLGVCAWGVHCAPAGTSGVLELLNGGGLGWTDPNGACFVNSSQSCGAGLSRTQRHHSAWVLLVSSPFMWSELTAWMLRHYNTTLNTDNM